MAQQIVGMSLDYLVKNLYNLIYPVGICIDFDTESVNPNVAFPGTTWVRISDGAYVVSGAVGTEIGRIGGHKGFTIGVANLPNHSHTMAHTHTIDHNHGTIESSSSGAHTHTGSGNTGQGGNHSHSRGTMNITGFVASPATALPGQTDLAYVGGAFTAKKPNPERISKTANSTWSERYIYQADFDASRTWTGSTSEAGTHNHSYSFTTSTSTTHVHSTTIPKYTGNSGGSSAASTGAVGTGAEIEFTPTFHRYARWKRTA